MLSMFKAKLRLRGRGSKFLEGPEQKAWDGLDGPLVGRNAKLLRAEE